MDRGFIRLWRKCKDHPFYNENRPLTKREAWEEILLNVNHKEKRILIKGKELVCCAGQSVKSLEVWSMIFKWNKSKTRRFFEWLKSANQIDTVNETVTLRLIVLNYKVYNPTKKEIDTVLKHKPTRNRHATDTQPTLNNNDNNDNNEINNTYSEDSKELYLSNLLFDLIKKNDDKAKKPNIQKWAADIKKINRLDNRSWEDIKITLCWSQQDDFWKTNILSASKLRKQFSKLFLKAKSSSQYKTYNTVKNIDNWEENPFN